MPFKCTKTKKS